RGACGWGCGVRGGGVGGGGGGGWSGCPVGGRGGGRRAGAGWAWWHLGPGGGWWPGRAVARGVGAVAEPGLAFAGLLRQLRDEAELTQEELAEAAGGSARSGSDLGRGITRPARLDTARLLGGALGLARPAPAPVAAG